MKTKIFLIIVGLLLVGCSKTRTVSVDAEVLSISTDILEGKLIGQFLGSSSGHLVNDKVKVGVKFELNGYLFLRDIELNHAELCYFKECSTIPLTIHILYNGNNSGINRILIRLLGRGVYQEYLPPEFALKLLVEKNVKILPIGKK